MYAVCLRIASNLTQTWPRPAKRRNTTYKIQTHIRFIPKLTECVTIKWHFLQKKGLLYQSKFNLIKYSDSYIPACALT